MNSWLGRALVVQGVLLSACGLGGDGMAQGGADDSDIPVALAALRALEGMVPARSIAWARLALEQPEFVGVVREHGCIVRYDEKNEPVWAITLKTFDYRRQKPVTPRLLTPEELQRSRDQLKAYYETRRRAGQTARVLPILSQSFRLACCEALLNESDETIYTTGRGTRDLEVRRTTRGETTLIAAEGVWMREK